MDLGDGLDVVFMILNDHILMVKCRIDRKSSGAACIYEARIFISSFQIHQNILIWLRWHCFTRGRQHFKYRKSKNNSNCLLPCNLARCMGKFCVYKTILNKDIDIFESNMKCENRK